jgi:HemK-like putative methylase
VTSAEFLASVPARARHDAIWLLSSLWNCSLAEVNLDAHRAFTPAEEKSFRAWWKRRGAGEPLQYIAGGAPFWGREFLVNRHTLIPRPETEVLVDLALKYVRAGDRVLDIGTGTGCIASTLKLENATLTVTGSDISTRALTMARKNAALLGATVSFEKHDLFAPRLQKANFDIVVSNPPYLEFKRDKIAADVQEWELREWAAALHASRVEPAGGAGDGEALEEVRARGTRVARARPHWPDEVFAGRLARAIRYQVPFRGLAAAIGSFSVIGF